MELALDTGGSHHQVRFCRVGLIAVGDRELSSSFLLTPERLIADWPPRSLDQLNDSNLQLIFDLKPELVLLGSGSRQLFPPSFVSAFFLTRGIGFEAMSNPAAARTFNLLASEGRRVAAGFLLPG